MTRLKQTEFSSQAKEHRPIGICIHVNYFLTSRGKHFQAGQKKKKKKRRGHFRHRCFGHLSILLHKRHRKTIGKRSNMHNYLLAVVMWLDNFRFFKGPGHRIRPIPKMIWPLFVCEVMDGGIWSLKVRAVGDWGSGPRPTCWGFRGWVWGLKGRAYNTCWSFKGRC